MQDEYAGISPTPGALSILLVDDSIVLRSILRMELQAAGFEVCSVQSGLDGIEALDSDRDYDLILTDFHMPGMDGAEFVGCVRRHPRHKRVPILVLTADADVHEKERARDAGANGWIVKPFDTAKLAAAIHKLAH
jgi:two-component system chemotaxis response regulator CheY